MYESFTRFMEDVVWRHISSISFLLLDLDDVKKLLFSDIFFYTVYCVSVLNIVGIDQTFFSYKYPKNSLFDKLPNTQRPSVGKSPVSIDQFLSD